MKRAFFIFLSIFTIFLIGCGTNPGETELEPPDRSPESLIDVSSGIDDIGESLDGIEKIIMDLPKKENGEMSDMSETEDQGQDSGGEKGQGNGNSQGGSQKQEGQSQEQSQESQETPKTEEEIKNQKIKNMWQDIEKSLEGIHSAWNEYQVEGQKKGASREQLDSLEGSLNSLTIAVEKNSIRESYNGMSQCYLFLRPIFDLYQDDIMAELTVLKYDTYRAYSIGISDEEGRDFQIFESNDELFSRISRKVDDDSKDDLIDRLENSISSLKKGLREDSRRVNMIKKNIVLENIKELEE